MTYRTVFHRPGARATLRDVGELEIVTPDALRQGVHRVRPVGREGGGFYVSAYALTPVEPADDPSKDPVGTIRENTGELGGSYIRMWRDGKKEWVWVSDDSKTSFRASKGNTTIGPIIGAVPGTPAAGAQTERPLWTGDGSEEPPEYVKVIRNCDGEPITRRASGWVFSQQYDDPYSWDQISPKLYGPYTEVRDGA